MPTNSGMNGTELGDFIQAYEAARADGKCVDLEPFLPPPDHPLYAEVHRQLLAYDLEYRARRGEVGENHVARTVWNNGRVGPSKTSLQLQSGSSSAAQNEDATTARVVVRVQSPEDLGIGSRSAPRAFGQS